ncbi:MAG: integral rane sensor signal transduction histidine kinase [Paenibacillus sp.]|jgi:two-component system sensor histidine kinase YesM|nr:integral rane sensor signal transduction histidine kinase [Paenibacillus sp.]
MKIAFPSFRQTYRKLRIRHKIFLLVLLIMLGCFAITYTVLQYAYLIYDRQIYEKSSQVLDLSSTLIENELKKIESVSYSIATDPEIQAGLLKLKEQATDYEQLRIRTDVVDRLIQYIGNERFIYSAEVIDMWGGQYVGGLGVSRTPEALAAIKQTAELSTGESRWMYPTTAGEVLTMVKQIRSYKNLSLEPIGTLVIRIKFDSVVSSSMAYTDIKQGEMIISAEDKVIYPLQTDMSIAIQPVPQPVETRYEVKNIGGDRYFITNIKSPHTGWLYQNVLPFNYIFNRIILMKQVLYIVFAASLLLVIVLALQFARSITKPIENLMGKMKKVQNGQLDLAVLEEPPSTSISMDEVGQLQRTFRFMMQQIDELIIENYKKQLTIRETQFQALQAQINPHFLYNTLESINWLAKVNDQKEISSMVEALGVLFRNSINITDTLVPIEQDLEIALHYVTIQKFRFQERLLFRVEMEHAFRQQRIPKLTLQPLLENAIHYGLEPQIEPCLISISAYAESDRLVVQVTDQGQGMDHEQLEKVRNGQFVRKGHGIGLSNIDERIKLAFGEEYGIRIDSEPGQGTRVSIYLPFLRGSVGV